MKLTVLGNNGPYPSAGSACSGYLVQEGKRNILLDCGNGVLSNLFKIIDFDGLDGIMLTHLHSDHVSDMMILKYAVEIKKKRGMFTGVIDVFAPPEPEEEFKRLDAENVFNLKPIDENLVLKYDNLTVTFLGMRHPVKTYAVAIDNERKRFVFSGDTSWNKQIIDFSKGADLLMLDAGLLSRDKTDDNVPHMTAYECGIVGREAGVKRLMLTHFWPDYDINELLSEAKQNYNNVEASRLLASYEI